MVFTTVGKEMVAYRLGSDIAYPVAYAIGTGSAAVTATGSALTTESDRQNFTGSPNFTEARKVKFQSNWNSIEMSGTTLTEWGVFDNSTASTGSMYQREGFAGIEFDGTNELQIETTWEVL